MINDLTEMTNFHTHGFHVSPGGHSDNIFVMIPPVESFQYEYQIPTNHSPGLYWYHRHPHGISDDHVAGGLAGVIVNEGELDQLPGIVGLTERLVIIQATQFGPDGAVVAAGDQSATTQLHLINGQLQPVIRMRPGETQRWRIANISAGNFYNLALAGHPLHQIMGSPSQFLIDGQMFDPDRIDQTVQLNALEEWVIHNTSEDWHPFHIHVNDFQVVAVNGEPIVSHSFDDTYLVPPYGSITMRTRFLDLKGTFVYHCHILFHEDHGMMGVVAVV